MGILRANTGAIWCIGLNFCSQNFGLCTHASLTTNWSETEPEDWTELTTPIIQGVYTAGIEVILNYHYGNPPGLADTMPATNTTCGQASFEVGRYMTSQVKRGCATIWEERLIKYILADVLWLFD